MLQDLALNKLYNVPLAPDGVAGCWKGQDVPCGGLPRSGFTFLVIHSNMFKGMALAAPPGSVVRPDVSDKSMCPKDPDFLPETGKFTPSSKAAEGPASLLTQGAIAQGPMTTTRSESCTTRSWAQTSTST